MICKVQRSWRPFHDVTIIRKSRQNCMQVTSQLSTPLHYELILRIYAATNGLGGGVKIEFVPGRGETLGMPLVAVMCWFCECRTWVMERSMCVLQMSQGGDAVHISQLDCDFSVKMCASYTSWKRWKAGASRCTSCHESEITGKVVWER